MNLTLINDLQKRLFEENDTLDPDEKEIIMSQICTEMAKYQTGCLSRSE